MADVDWERITTKSADHVVQEYDYGNIDVDVERISFDESSGYHRQDENGDCALIEWDKWEKIRARLLALEMAYKALSI